MQLTMPSAMTPELIGFASLFTSTVSSVGLHLLERSTGVSVEKDTCTTRHALPAGQLGKETTPYLFVVIVDFGDSLLFITISFGFCDLSKTVLLRIYMLGQVFRAFVAFEMLLFELLDWMSTLIAICFALVTTPIWWFFLFFSFKIYPSQTNNFNKLAIKNIFSILILIMKYEIFFIQFLFECCVWKQKPSIVVVKHLWTVLAAYNRAVKYLRILLLQVLSTDWKPFYLNFRFIYWNIAFCLRFSYYIFDRLSDDQGFNVPYGPVSVHQPVSANYCWHWHGDVFFCC